VGAAPDQSRGLWTNAVTLAASWRTLLPHEVIGADANQLLIDSAIINPQKPVSSELVFFQPQFPSASRSHREW
jgi:hypothetical protein